MLTGLTTDREYAARAIEGLGVVRTLEPSSDPLGLAGEPRAAVGGSEMAEMADQEIAAQMAVLREALRRQYQHRVDDLVASLDDLAQALSSLRGRKQIVLLSGGVRPGGVDGVVGAGDALESVRARAGATSSALSPCATA